jgi:hypothetical protein
MSCANIYGRAPREADKKSQFLFLYYVNKIRWTYLFLNGYNSQLSVIISLNKLYT